MHSTEWVIQVEQRPPGTSKPLPDASRQLWCLYAVKAAYSELGGLLSFRQGSIERQANSHFLLRHESQALFLLGFEEDMDASD